MLHIRAKHAVITLVAAVLYFVLTYYLQGPAFVHVPRFTWIQENFGNLAEARIWAHSAHGLALLLAAIPGAIVISVADVPQPVRAAAVAGALTALAGFAPTLLTESVRPYLDATTLGHMAVDAIKFVLLMMFVTWIFTKLPSNHAMRRSSHVGTPP